MAKVTLPKNMRPKPLADGTVAYFWELPKWARPTREKGKKPVAAVRHGRPCPFYSEALGSDLPQAIIKAEGLNEGLEQWRTGTGSSLVKGSVKWLFAWYRTQPRFADKISHKTREDYLRLMATVEGVPMKDGTKFETRAAKAVTATVADHLFAKLMVNGERQAAYAMQVCSRVWNEAVRHIETTGIAANPFAKMGLPTRAKQGNRATTRAEYDLYRETARAMGLQSMATAAALSFELAQRVWDVFGFADPDGKKARGITWLGYRPEVSMTLTQSKTGRVVTIPLFDRDSAVYGPRGVIALYPDLEAELARTPRTGDMIVIEERTGLPYAKRQAAKVHRMICDKAGLPGDMTFTGFRHGGATEIGDAGETDIRAITGHTQLDTTAIYNKASEEKARQIGRARRAHVDRVKARKGG